jgi:hypothetical protein
VSIKKIDAKNISNVVFEPNWVQKLDIRLVDSKDIC